MPLSTQEWGDVENEFAEWIAENEEFQDDSPNSLFEVENDDGERIFHIDTSPTDDLGSDLAEAEFPHSQFGAEHLTNLKQAVKWMSTLEVKPSDFRAAKWMARNRDQVEQVLDFDIGSEFANLQQRTRQNSFEIKENEGRVADAVERVDATRQEFGQLEEQLETVRGETRAVIGVVEEHDDVLSSRQMFEDRILSELSEIKDELKRGEKGDVVQEKWREVKADPEFSTPWFQDASDEYAGEFHLRAFRIGEGSETILDADTIARLRGG
jgi:hypothetical protein